MNGYKYKPSGVMFDERVRVTLSQIQKDYREGKIMTKSEYAYKIKNAVFNFYSKMGKPTYEFIPASDVPSFIHYKEMVENAKSDMSTVINGCEKLSEILTDMNISMLEETSIINNNISIIDNKVSEIEKKIRTISEASAMVFTDSFSSNKAYDVYDITGERRLSYADVEDKVCTLASNNEFVESGFDIEILNTSNGFPGNTHEVYESISGVKYVGETDPRTNLANVLSSNSDGVFEFEMYNLDDETRSKTSSIGFNYKEGISWINEENELRLDLKVTFKVPVKLNTLRLNGLPKVNFQTDHPTIKEIIIKDDYVGVQTIRYGGELLENTVISFKPQIVKEVIIKLSQRDSNITKVARNCSLSVDPTKVPYFFNDEFKDFTQVDRPTISIEDLGLTYNTKDKSIIYPSTKNSATFLSNEYIKSKLFYSNISSENNDKTFTEVINAYRYRIAISYIGFEYKEYTETGVYISSNFEVGNNIKKITLNANDKVPISFIDAEKDKISRPPFIGYYLSFDNEEDWYQIFPRTSNQSGPCSIVINSHLNVESRNPNVTYVDRLIDPTSVRIKIELRRPVNIIDETPVVNEYNLDIDGEE